MIPQWRYWGFFVVLLVLLIMATHGMNVWQQAGIGFVVGSLYGLTFNRYLQKGKK
jgi:apolipoprotein N-acyltransferase